MYIKFFEYVKKNIGIWIILYTYTILLRGFYLVSGVVGIDTEEMIGTQSLTLGWLDVGRYGLVLLKLIFSKISFNMYISGLVVVLLLPLVAIVWSFLLSYISGKENKIAIAVFGLTLLASSILTEQLYFKLQAMEVCTGLILSGASLMLCFHSFFESKSLKLSVIEVIGAIIINIITFGIYQSFVPLFVFGAAVSVFLVAYFDRERKNIILLVQSLKYIGVFAVALIINQIISKLVAKGGSDYLAGQIMWKELPVQRCLYLICAHIGSVLIGKRIYYSFTIGLAVIAFLVFVVIKTVKGSRENSFMLVLSAASVLISPFLITFLCGAEPIIRSQLVLVFVAAFLFFFITDNSLFEKKYFTYIGMGVAVIFVLFQSVVTVRLEATDYVRYKEDVKLAKALFAEIDEIRDKGYYNPVIIYGKRSYNYDKKYLKGETMGASFFEWDTDVAPNGYYNTKRILNFFNTLGKEYDKPSIDLADNYSFYATSLPKWPDEGSIVKVDGNILINLGN